MHFMDWDDLRFVLAVAREKNLTRAAKLLGVTHTTVSRRLSAFEERVGVRLFDRQPEGYVATAAGEDMIAAASRVEEEVLSLDSRVFGQDTRLSGPLRVTTVDVMAVRMAEPLAAFCAEYPGVSVELSVDNNFRSLTRREADIALRTTNRPPEHLVGVKLGHIEYAVYGAKSLLERIGSDAPLNDFPWVAWDERLLAKVTEERLHGHAPNANIVLRVDSPNVMNAVIRGGVGLGFMTCTEGDRDDDLVRLRPIETNFGTNIWLLTHPDLRHTARVRAFMDFMGDVLRTRREAWQGVPDADLGLSQP